MFYALPRFKYYKPLTLGEALEIISGLDDYKVMAGGTDLLIDIRIGRYRPNSIVDISGLKELDYIVDEGNVVRIGALTRLQELVDSGTIAKELPLLHKAVYNMASWQIRNMGTVGGNLCNASPAADTAPPLLAYNAKLVAVSSSGERIIGIEKFFLGPRRTVLSKGEILREIIVPKAPGYGYSYIKLGRRNAFTLSIVSVAVLAKTSDNIFEDVRIALNSIAPTPVRARSVEEFLVGKKVSDDVIEKASRMVANDISPITDVRASAEYRRAMAIVLTRDALLEALEVEGGGSL